MHGITWLAWFDFNRSYEWQKDWRPDYWTDYPELYLIFAFMIFSLLGILLCVFSLMMSGSMSIYSPNRVAEASIDKVVKGQKLFWRRAGGIFFGVVGLVIAAFLTIVIIATIETRRMRTIEPTIDTWEEDWPVEEWDDETWNDEEVWEEIINEEAPIAPPAPEPIEEDQ